jgi:hypothetical protein
MLRTMPSLCPVNGRPYRWNESLTTTNPATVAQAFASPVTYFTCQANDDGGWPHNGGVHRCTVHGDDALVSATEINELERLITDLAERKPDSRQLAGLRRYHAELSAGLNHPGGTTPLVRLVLAVDHQPMLAP